MKLKQIISAIAAGAVALSAMATSIAAEEVTVEKVLFANDANIGTVKFETSLTIPSNYIIDTSTSSGAIEVKIPSSVSVSYDDAPGLGSMDLFIQAKSLDFNGVKPFGDAVNGLNITSPLTINVKPHLFNDPDPLGLGTASIYDKTIYISGSNKLTVKGTFAYPGTLSTDQEELLTYADKLRITPVNNNHITADLRTLNLFENDSNKGKISVNPYTELARLLMSNVATFDGSDTTRQSVLETQAFTVAEKAAIKAEGARIQLVVEMANKAIGSSMSYITVRIWDEVRGEYSRPTAVMLDGTTATLDLNRNQVYQEAYDEFNKTYEINAGDNTTNTNNNYVKTAKLVITYDDGVAVDADDVADSEDEPEPDVEEDDFFDEDMPEDDDAIEEDFVDDDFAEDDDFVEDDTDDFIDDVDFEEDNTVTDDATVADDAAADETTDANPGTGVALAIVPALIAAAGVAIARKRS